jgi:hypothetical protein
MVFRARRLGQLDNQPVAVYNQKTSFAYITGSRVTALLRKAVRLVYPDKSKEELNKFSAHSFRVWACVLLDEAGKSPDFIKKRLGDSYRIYLRDTCAIQDQHREALASASLELMRIIQAEPEDVIELSTHPSDDAAGEYSDNEE